MPNWYEKLFEPRVGIMLHYDASASDEGAIYWLTKDPRCKVSYNWLVMDDGTIWGIAPWNLAAWHAGKCKPSNPRKLNYRGANSAFLGIAIAAADGQKATEKQKESVIHLCKDFFRMMQWKVSDTFRIVGHNTECWPRGRKWDPVGSNLASPVLDVEEIRRRISGEK